MRLPVGERKSMGSVILIQNFLTVDTIFFNSFNYLELGLFEFGESLFEIRFSLRDDALELKHTTIE